MLVQYLIYIHAFLAAIALMSGAVALSSRKGRTIHKKSGNIFTKSMFVSVVLSIIIPVLPDHENFLLFSIGFFSLYFLIAGNRALEFKENVTDLKLDKIVAVGVILVGLLMIFIPVVKLGKLNMILLIFGIVSILFGIRDMMLFRNRKKLQQSWLKLHVGKITGGYISAVSAFFVVNNFLPELWNWFAPGIVGSVYITYWMIKLNLKDRKNG